MTLSAEERETSFNQTIVDRREDTVYVCTSDPVWINKLEKLGYEGKVLSEQFGVMEFVCENSYITIRRRRSLDLTDEERQERAERLKEIREQ